MSPALLRPAPRWAIPFVAFAGGGLVFSLVWFCIEALGVTIR